MNTYDDTTIDDFDAKHAHECMCARCTNARRDQYKRTRRARNTTTREYINTNAINDRNERNERDALRAQRMNARRIAQFIFTNARDVRNVDARTILRMIDDNDRNATCDAQTIIKNRASFDDMTLCDTIDNAIKSYL